MVKKLLRLKRKLNLVEEDNAIVELKLQIVLKGQLDHLANPVNLAKMVILVKLENPDKPLKQQNLFKVAVVCHALLVLPDLLVL